MEPTQAKLGKRTKGIVAVLIALGGLLQVQEVHDSLLVMAHNHPHILSVIGIASTIAALLHNPEVKQCLGLDGSGEE